jgi:hypothetical protein
VLEDGCEDLPMQEVSAIGLKFPGSLGASLAVALGIRRITPSFQAVGITPANQQELYRLPVLVMDILKQCRNLIKRTKGKWMFLYA